MFCKLKSRIILNTAFARVLADFRNKLFNCVFTDLQAYPNIIHNSHSSSNVWHHSYLGMNLSHPNIISKSSKQYPGSTTLHVTPEFSKQFDNPLAPNTVVTLLWQKSRPPIIRKKSLS